jgi:hypothetical protein
VFIVAVTTWKCWGCDVFLTLQTTKGTMGGLASKLGFGGDGQIDLKPPRGPQNLPNCCMNCILIGRCGPYRGSLGDTSLKNAG